MLIFSNTFTDLAAQLESVLSVSNSSCCCMTVCIYMQTIPFGTSFEYSSYVVNFLIQLNVKWYFNLQSVIVAYINRTIIHWNNLFFH